MIVFKWQCACDLIIEATSEKQLEKAKLSHYKKHAKENGWPL